ncbi:choice-of-anchor I family protein [Aquabacterium sp. J223]|uniref:choice-of-anchor I family protein n=1 Tax=Aquabacterium sp. J223 TaxID=2898431 RepID=UPI0021AD6F91|nr:choice-of-anchor I family protein [Aquabacterium sp. J223]
MTARHPLSFLQPTRLAAAATLTLAASVAVAGPLDQAQLVWTQTHSAVSGFLSEIVSFDAGTKTLWVSGPSGVHVLDAKTGTPVSFINTAAFGSVNSVAIHNGIAALAVEASGDRRNNGQVLLYSTATRQLLPGTNAITVGALPDMLTFTPDGSKLLVANEGTPNAVADTPYVLNTDPVGSVSIIDMASRTVAANVTFGGLPQTGTNQGNVVRNPGMNVEPEYIAVSKDGSKAYVSLQEHNNVAVINLSNNAATTVFSLGTKDFNLPGNEIDTRDNNNAVQFVNVPLKGLYMPDALGTHTDASGKHYFITVNEGDFREDNVDRTTVNAVSGNTVPNNNYGRVRITTDSTLGNYYAAGARSFSIRDENGDLVYDSGSILDREANKLGLYDDERSRDKGVEPEGLALLTIGGRTYAFIGLERTKQGSVAVFDITDPADTSFVRLLVNDGLLRPEGLTGFEMDGFYYLAVANEGADGVNPGTALFALAPIPEPETYALMLGGLGVVGWAARRRKAS